MKHYFKYGVVISLGIILTTGAGCSLIQPKPAAPTNNNSNTNVSVNTNASDPVVDSTLDSADDTSKTNTDVVTSDVFGEDMKIVERYPNSIRSYYSKNELETDITY